MTILHPISSMETARLAARVLAAGDWEHINRVQARETVAVMERVAISGPAEGSPGARVLDAGARRISALATDAYDARELNSDGRDLSWLRDPVRMDGMQRDAFAY